MKYILAIIPISLFVLAATPATAQVYSGPKWAPTNFDTTVNGNFRGAKITGKAQLDSMRRIYGVTTVINLAKDALPKKGGTEIEWTKELGMEYISVYLGSKPPNDEGWAKIKAAMDNGKAYIHCAHGADRTGAVIARYRLDNNQASPEQAYKEARRYGFKPWLKDLRAWMKWTKSDEKK